MPISVNPILPVLAAQAAAPDLLLQPGTVVDAQVLKILSDNLVQIAIAGFSIDVLSEVPLIAGQTLQLAVSQTPDSVRLAIVGPGSRAAAGISGDGATLSPNTIPEVAANPSPGAAPSKNVLNVLTPPEQAAVAVAAQSAATRQESLAPLFANLGAVAGSNSLPSQLQQAVLQVLAQRTGFDQNLTGGDIQNAFQKSGVFLEASLASGSVPPGNAMPDLKAALIVLRQALVSVGAAEATQTGVAPAMATQQPVVPGAQPSLAPETSVGSAGDAASQPLVAAASTPAPPLASGIEATEILLPQGHAPASGDAGSPPHAVPGSTPAPSLAPGIEPTEILPPQGRATLAGDLPELSGAIRIVLPETLLNAAPRTFTAGAAMNLLQQALQEMPKLAGNALPPTVISRDSRPDDVTFHTNTPPPPFRGALPSAQPIALPSIASDAPLATSAPHLLADTDAAIARQTLLQVASLPESVDTAGARLDPATPRWSFEIPFAMPQGTAMAQFEIARDGGGNEVEAAKRVWQARFSLDVEPAGPVHALVSLVGERTSVRMWAERPATAAQLRAGAGELSQALSKAELVPGDIVIRDGAPQPTAPARAGHFLDRAL
jgi:Flagellar hook-length control protein FliK